MDLKDFLEKEGYDIGDCIVALATSDTELLEEVSDRAIEEYARWYLDMIESEDCECGESLEKASTTALWDAYTYLLRYGDKIPEHAESIEILTTVYKLMEIKGYYPFMDKFEEFKQTF